MHTEADKIPRRDCLKQAVHVVCFFVSETAGTASIFSLCFDRFSTICKPTHPYRLQTLRTKKIGIMLILLSSFFTFVLVIVCGICDSNELLSASCIASDLVGRVFYDIHYKFNAIIGMSTVLLYLLTLATIRKKTKNSIGAVADIQLRRQVVVTKRLSVVLFSTFLLQVVPFLMLNASTWSNWLWKSMILITVWPRGIGMTIYPIVLVFVQPELKHHVKKLVGKITKTPTVDAVNSYATTVRMTMTGDDLANAYRRGTKFQLTKSNVPNLASKPINNLLSYRRNFANGI
ncbi:hypothetical protein M514_04872 [Trichuris suis]|uniref:G-protein coupled receptors family 1 profile domain-containing protein n=1 Tax=Trichuris suis TaxID=68888 RepID=A0A085MAT4_9BILA|nr:hypothetical protein M513_04872 [Trichuris suis]KFD73110.1 hypothetical protein M514_04872 [Trichuris suis]KHJ45639.1 hypothetical protein D918_04376 [Trichuris suis]